MLKLSSKDSFVIYRLPNEEKIISLQGSWEKREQEEEGFIVRPFDKNEIYILKKERKFDEKEISIQPDRGNSTELQINKKDYLVQVEKYIEACNSNLQKAISSRILTYKTEEQINLYDLFLELSRNHPKAFVYLLNIPEQGMWMGATPEILLKSREREFITMALAGSKNIDNHTDWQEKEIKEHLYVVDDIKQKLSNHNIDFKTDKMQTVEAGKVSHLQTLVSILKKDLSPLSIAEILHPTSAVCGMPQEEAQKFILNTERHQRALYTGYLGILDKKETSLFVNLRSMQIYANRFDLYIGGGITQDSVPLKEWEETELKSQTLLAIIKKMQKFAHYDNIRE